MQKNIIYYETICLMFTSKALSKKKKKKKKKKKIAYD